MADKEKEKDTSLEETTSSALSSETFEDQESREEQEAKEVFKGKPKNTDADKDLEAITDASKEAAKDASKDSSKSVSKETSKDSERKLPEKPEKTLFEKIITVLLITVGAVIVILLGARMYFRIPVRNYYKASDRTFTIPDIGNGFIAQGLSYDSNGSRFLVTGYMKDGSASPIYVLNKSKSLVQKITLADTAGIPLNIHAGGLSVYGDYVYVTGSGSTLFIYSYGKIMTAAEGASVTAVGEIEVPDIRTAWTTVSDDYLIVGEFHREKNYPTPDSHKLTTPCGDKNEALAIAFKLSENAEFGIDTTPCFAYSLPDKVQGMAVNEGKVYLSTSYGAAFSHIYIYDFLSQKSDANTGTINYEGSDLPIYYCDSAVLAADIKIAPMSEEIEFVDGKMYTMCESASDKYFFGKLTGARKVYATDMNKLILLGKDDE